MNFKATIPMLLSVVLLGGCAKAIRPGAVDAMTNQRFKVEGYDGGRPVRERWIEAESPEHAKLKTWLLAHPTGWRGSYITYAPRVLVSGTNFSLNVFPDFVVLNCQGQYVRDLSGDELGFLVP
jgi:hypothetical protein